MAEQLPLPSRAPLLGVLSAGRCYTSERGHHMELLPRRVRGEPPLGHTTGGRPAQGHGWPCSGYPWLAPACCFPTDGGTAAFGCRPKASGNCRPAHQRAALCIHADPWEVRAGYDSWGPFPRTFHFSRGANSSPNRVFC